MRFRIGIHLGDVIEKADGTVYGDGVNIAARLQALAEPGGIMVSHAVQGASSLRSGADFEDIGEQAIKNIAKPVRAFRLLHTVAAPVQHAKIEATSCIAGTIAGAVRRLSVLVLPFVEPGAPPEQEYFADAITDDVTTQLCKIRGSYVIGSSYGAFIQTSTARTRKLIP